MDIMSTSVSAKRCPRCGKVTGLHTTECGSCGHRFRTRFAQPTERTEAFDAVVLPRPPAANPPMHPSVYPPMPRRWTAPPFVMAFLGSFCLVATVGIAAWIAWGFSQGPSPQPAPSLHPSVSAPAGGPLPAAYSGARRTGRAEDLYERIGIAMSLYDVDQAAGGMGRLAHSSDPHVLLLSYDYPDQSVRVSLYRGDLTGDDYRVQAIALYHGNVLLHRHTDDN